jgi:tetratricopeptide (TPR) repeat protein
MPKTPSEHIDAQVDSGLQWLQTGIAVARGRSRDTMVRALAAAADEAVFRAATAYAALLGRIELLTAEGRLDDAEAYFERALDVQREVLGDSAALGALTNNFGKLLTLRGDLQRADRLLQESLSLQTRFVGADSPDAGFTHLSLGDLQLVRGEVAAALDSYRLATALFEGRFGAEHLFTARARLATAPALARSGQAREAAVAYRQSLAALEALPGTMPARLRGGGHCLRLQDSLARRLPSLDSSDLVACEAHAQSLGAQHYERIEAELLLALVRGEAGPRPPALAALEAALGPNSPRLAQMRALVR